MVGGLNHEAGRTVATIRCVDEVLLIVVVHQVSEEALHIITCGIRIGVVAIGEGVDFLDIGRETAAGTGTEVTGSNLVPLMTHHEVDVVLVDLFVEGQRLDVVLAETLSLALDDLTIVSSLCTIERIGVVAGSAGGVVEVVGAVEAQPLGDVDISGESTVELVAVAVDIIIHILADGVVGLVVGT